MDMSAVTDSFMDELLMSAMNPLPPLQHPLLGDVGSSGMLDPNARSLLGGLDVSAAGFGGLNTAGFLPAGAEFVPVGLGDPSLASSGANVALLGGLPALHSTAGLDDASAFAAGRAGLAQAVAPPGYDLDPAAAEYFGQAATGLEWVDEGARPPLAQSNAQHRRAIIVHLVGQAMRETGMTVAKTSAVDMLADVYIEFIEKIGAVAQAYAEHAGRTEGNANDLRASLADFSSNARLRSANEMLPDLPFRAGSWNQSNLVNPLDYNTESLTRFLFDSAQGSQEKHALVQTRIEESEFRELAERQNDPHYRFFVSPVNMFDDPEAKLVPDFIPSFLPRYPANHTYLRTLIMPKRLTDWHQVRPIWGHQQRDVAVSLSNFLALTEQHNAEPVSTDKSVQLAKVKPEAVIVEPHPSYCAPIVFARGPNTMGIARERMTSPESRAAGKACVFFQKFQQVRALPRLIPPGETVGTK
ncbi:hypothetical protein CAOG_05570 [Capsaspora owczarzaki ATCC 30864]|uniref:Transcription initiation factor TFIID subunit 8 n=1 Tax=Capsaspora owczarzaki (strain ATCC 30864) TaxID=595528 RepID=A0A0D2WTQ0_CAPO3|nr:hypothetical protein CAOG_05570 [Capsaspora owczarzaki ATCC 30864]KJE95078.1 hypothetical protein CAOG_005570 [Capsaspora owczarzaki ATCC 30864]|eukprot:XP_004346243.2 hypothetical protein CAOG_05570 [Capsaspora owczarzaki ATCC 30864]